MTLAKTTEIARLIDSWPLTPERPQRELYRVLVDDPLDGHILLLYLAGIGADASCATLQVFSRAPGANIRSSHLRGVKIDLEVVARALDNGGSWRRPRRSEDARWSNAERALRDDDSDPIENLWALAKPRPPVQRRGLDAPLPREHFEEVARLYDEAVRLGTGTADYISQRMGDPAESTVRGWISRARKLGLLPATKAGQKLGNTVKAEPSPREVEIRY